MNTLSYNILAENITKKVMTLIESNKIGGMNYANRGDSFYTQRYNIDNELKNYDFKGKIVYCNCDNPSMSNFYKFFKENYHNLELNGLYATYYDKIPKMYFYNGSQETSKIIQSGRFQDNAEIMKMCDVVVTNPPFSGGMPRELINMARGMGKHIIMVGPKTLANRKEMFELLKNNNLNMGHTTINRFLRPDGTKKTAPTAWWTTMPLKKKFFYTGKKYDPSLYQKYDDIDAIYVNDYRDIPDDYYGYIGVSANFLRVLNRDQFELVDKVAPKLNGKTKFDTFIIKRKPQQQMKQVVENITNNVISQINEGWKNWAIASAIGASSLFNTQPSYAQTNNNQIQQTQQQNQELTIDNLKKLFPQAYKDRDKNESVWFKNQKKYVTEVNGKICLVGKIAASHYQNPWDAIVDFYCPKDKTFIFGDFDI